MDTGGPTVSGFVNYFQYDEPQGDIFQAAWVTCSRPTRGPPEPLYVLVDRA
jgi:hypothetical protein